ncbi:hypothetical protein KA013_00330 [Patescibacteria group bacterium]|nr:hypothetical protein [Patescibacteria group bacterium]
MKKIETLTRSVLSNISHNFGGDSRWVRPLKEIKNVVINNKPTNVHVARIGVSDGEDDFSDVLIYIDGYGGLIVELPDETYSYEENGKVKIRPIKVLKEDNKLFLVINPHTEYVYPHITFIQEHNSYGYTHNGELVLVDFLNSNAPIQVEVYKADMKVNLQQIIDMGHPNLLVYLPTNMESILMVYNKDATQRQNLDSSWHCEDFDRKEYFNEIRKFIEESVDIQDAQQAFTEWWRKEGKTKYGY